jgi:hypothetical protein
MVPGAGSGSGDSFTAPGNWLSDNSLSPFARFGLDAYAPTTGEGAPGLDAQACEKVYCGRGCLQVVAKVVIARST